MKLVGGMMIDTSQCNAFDICDRPPDLYVEMAKKTWGHTDWKSGCYCIKHAYAMQHNLEEQGYSLHLQMTVDEYKRFMGEFDDS